MSAYKNIEEITRILPALSDDEYKSLKESIKLHGIKEPVKITSDGYVIDGLHRLRAASELGIEAPMVSLKVDREQAISLGLALNLCRRQLSPEQVRYVHEQLRKDKEQRQKVALKLREEGKTQEAAAAMVGVSRRTVDEWETKFISDVKIDNGNKTDEKAPKAKKPKLTDRRVTISKDDYKKIYELHKAGETQEKIAADYKVTQPRISNIITMVEARNKIPEPVQTPEFPKKKYRCIVIDPPWPVEKIELEVRPKQGVALDYPTMSLEEIEKLPIGDLADEDGCHIYLWVTQKYLPEGLRLLESWGVKYECTLVWVKSNGMPPFSWQYNVELVLFGKIGHLKLEKLGEKLSFEGKAIKHSRKPDTFYEKAVRVSPEPRLDMFSREERKGFEPWGSGNAHPDMKCEAIISQSACTPNKKVASAEDQWEEVAWESEKSA